VPHADSGLVWWYIKSRRELRANGLLCALWATSKFIWEKYFFVDIFESFNVIWLFFVYNNVFWCFYKFFIHTMVQNERNFGKKIFFHTLFWITIILIILDKHFRFCNTFFNGFGSKGAQLNLGPNPGQWWKPLFTKFIFWFLKYQVTSWCSGRLIGSPRQRSRVQDPISTINIHEGGH
jgi:hypothetical protein